MKNKQENKFNTLNEREVSSKKYKIFKRREGATILEKCNKKQITK